MSETICWKCNEPITEDTGIDLAYLSHPARFAHKKCPDMSETNEIVHCPECGHRGFLHSALHNQGTCGVGSCGCIRTYESLVGEKQAKQLTPELQQYFDKCEQAREKDMATELQLLVIDMGDSCVVKVEKGKYCDVQFGNGDDRNDIVYSAVPTIIWASFTELREAIDGVKPVPRIERCDTTEQSYEIINIYGDGAGILYQTAYDALSELAGKPLPIYEGGTWEDLLPLPDIGIGWELPIGVWRYTR